MENKREDKEIFILGPDGLEIITVKDAEEMGIVVTDDMIIN